MQFEFLHIGGSDQPVSSNDLTELQLRIEHALAFSKSGTVAVDARWLSILLDKIAALEDPLSKAEAAEEPPPEVAALKAEVKRLRDLIDRDRTGLARALNDIRREVNGLKDDDAAP